MVAKELSDLKISGQKTQSVTGFNSCENLERNEFLLEIRQRYCIIS
jgi:hypothetical protein